MKKHLMIKYRSLTAKEIETLEKNECRADSWDNIQVVDNFTPEFISKTKFSGKILLGEFEKEFQLAGGLTKHSCISCATIHNCEIGNNVVIENVQNYIANYIIGDNCFIQNVDIMLVDSKSTFGNGVEVAVLNETGGREVHIHDKISANLADR